MGRGKSVCETLEVLLRNDGWKVFVASGKLPRFQRIMDMIWTVYKYRNQYPAALIEVFSGNAFIWAEIIAWLLRVLEKPYILALYGGNLPNFAPQHPMRIKRLLHSANVVISPSAYTKELMLPYRSDIKVFPYGVDHSYYIFRLRKHPEPNLITMRAFHHIYNLTLAPKVLALLINEFSNIELVMTGGNKHDGSWEAVQQTSIDLGVQKQINMLGFVPNDQLPVLLNRADIILNTPEIDNTPVSLLEAMTCGLCIVSTNVGGIPYLLENEVDALLVQPNDPTAMAAAVRRILTEPGLAEKLSTNARKKAESYDWSVVLPKWEALFTSLISHA